jgi:hypothetical protein
MGAVLAMILSFDLNRSICWAIIHGICCWFYVIYRGIKNKLQKVLQCASVRCVSALSAQVLFFFAATCSNQSGVSAPSGSPALC